METEEKGSLLLRKVELATVLDYNEGLEYYFKAFRERVVVAEVGEEEWRRHRLRQRSRVGLQMAMILTFQKQKHFL